MARRSDRPLTVEEAKNRLRMTTEDALPSGYLRRHPYGVLIAAFAAGYLLGRTPSVQNLVTRTMLKQL